MSEIVNQTIHGLKQQYISAKSHRAEFQEPYDSVIKRREAEKADIDVKYAEQNAELFGEYDAARLNESAAENTLREALKAWHDETGEKTFDEDLSVRVNASLFYENSKAVEWAEKNAPFLIEKTVDKKQFEVIALAKDLDFVTVEKKVTAVVSKKL
jgi:hypothetical protein